MAGYTSVSIGVSGAGSSSGGDLPGAGHLYIALGTGSGGTTVLQAGPDAAGNLAAQTYAQSPGTQGDGTGTVVIGSPDSSALAQKLLEFSVAYDLGTSTNPLAYGDVTSNAYVDGLLSAAGFTDQQISDLHASLLDASGLSVLPDGTGTDANYFNPVADVVGAINAGETQLYESGGSTGEEVTAPN